MGTWWHFTWQWWWNSWTHTSSTTPEGLTGTGDEMVAAAEAHNTTEEEEDAQQQRHTNLNSINR